MRGDIPIRRGLRSRTLKRQNPKVGTGIDASAGKAAAAIVAPTAEALEQMTRMS